MKIQAMDGRIVDHRRIRRNVYRLLRVIRKKGYGQAESGGVDGNIRRHRNIALYRLKRQLRYHQRVLDEAKRRYMKNLQKLSEIL